LPVSGVAIWGGHADVTYMAAEELDVAIVGGGAIAARTA
jgi:hypothetical protein